MFRISRDGGVPEGGGVYSFRDRVSDGFVCDVDGSSLRKFFFGFGTADWQLRLRGVFLACREVYPVGASLDF